MSAPAALAFAKLFYPETEKSKTKADNITIEEPKEANVLDAATQGATSAGLLVVNITAIVVAFIAFMAFLNSVVAFLGDLVGVSGLSFDFILGKIFIPLSFVMGVDWEDCEKVSRLIGIKTILNEFIAYRELGVLIEAGEISARSQVIATYALCGFANPGSIGTYQTYPPSLPSHPNPTFPWIKLCLLYYQVFSWLPCPPWLRRGNQILLKLYLEPSYQEVPPVSSPLVLLGHFLMKKTCLCFKTTSSDKK